jgi:hypothetical protein
MIKQTIEWHNAAEELPEKSGEVLVRTRTNFYFANFSSKYKLFNTQDYYDEQTMRETAFEDGCVQYWAEIPDLTETEREGA